MSVRREAATGRAPWLGGKTIGDALSSRGNALNFVRLLLATTVIVSHTLPLGGYGVEADLGGLTLGKLAVAGFFAISGYLITVSRMRLPLGRFLLNRAARILPGFWVCLVVVAFVIAPLMELLCGTGWWASSAIAYVVRNAGLYVVQGGIGGGPTGVPYPGDWNGSLWTLFFEFAAYIVTAALFSIPIVRRRPDWFAGGFLAFAIIGQILAPVFLAAVSTYFYQYVVTNGLWLGAFYAAGMLIAVMRTRVPVSAPLACAAAAVFVAAGLTHTVTTLGVLPLAYLVLWAGATLPVRLGAKNDVSYGVYIYAFPVQQSLAALGVGDAAPFAVFVLASLGITSVLAWASWSLIERPAMNLARRMARRPSLRLP